MPRTWLVKSEPDVYGYHDLERDGRTAWDGVRNYSARNFMRDDMRPGDRVLFYHSNTSQLGVVGVAEVASEAYPDPTQFDPNDPHFDPKATEAEPRWYLVDVAAKRRLARTVTLAEMKADPQLVELPLVRRGNRLSVMPVGETEAERILELAASPAGDAED